MLKAAGNRLVVLPDPIETKTKSGIVINYAENERLEEGARTTGTVLDVGPVCWYDYPGWPDNPWCKVGDRVFWAKYAGATKVDPETQEKYVILNDEDVIAVVSDGSNHQ